MAYVSTRLLSTKLPDQPHQDSRLRPIFICHKFVKSRLKASLTAKNFYCLCVFIIVWFQKPNDGFDYFVRLRLSGKANVKMKAEKAVGGNGLWG